MPRRISFSNRQGAYQPTPHNWSRGDTLMV